MKEYKCHFHRNVKAQSKCVQCGSFICLDCTQKKGICPVCYQKNVENQYGPSLGIAMSILAIFFLTTGIVAISIDGNGLFFFIFGLVVSSLIGILIYYNYVKVAPREKEKARQTLEKAQQALAESEGNESINYEDEEKKTGRVELTCRFCGASINQGDTTCKYCGTSWVWENS